jgi:hypothetical protein
MGLKPDFLKTRFYILKYGGTYQIATKLPIGHKIFQLFLLQSPPKFIQIGIFCLKKYHLESLLENMSTSSNIML